MARRSWFRRFVGAGVLAGAAYAVWRAIEANRPAGDTAWEPQPFPFPPQPRATEPDTADASEVVTAPVSAPVEPTPEAAVETPDDGDARDGAGDDAASEDAWIASADGTCPTSHPVKVARASEVFHVPDGQMYERTTAARCYRDPAAAEADGLRRSKR